MNKEHAVFYTNQLRHGYDCHMPVVDYARERSIQNGAIIVIDMVPGKGADMYNNKTQLEYMKEVFNQLKDKTLTINCGIGENPKRSQDLVGLNTVICNRSSSGSVLRGSVSVSNLYKGQPLIEVIGIRDPIIVMGFDANVCVKSSIFGSNVPASKEKTDHIVGLLDLEKTVITSKVLLEPLNENLNPGYGILTGQ